MDKFWNVTPSLLDKDVLNMYVYGDIVTNSSFWSGSPDDVVTREFLKDLNKNPDVKRINVYINSGGGEVFAAVSIAQQLKKHKAEVHTYVEGICASAATIIAMCGDVRHMTLSGVYMIHLPSSGVRGNKHSFAKGIEVLEKVEDLIRLTYKNKTNLSDEELTQMLEHETWLTAEEAYTYGFITDIEEVPDKIDNLIEDIQKDIIAMNGVEVQIAAYADPEQLRAKLTEIQLKNNKGGNIMDFPAFLNSLPVDKRSAVEDAIKQQISAKTEELDTQVTNLSTQLGELTTQLTNVQETLNTTQQELTVAQNRANEAEQKLSNATNEEDADTKFLNSLPAEARQAVLTARNAAEVAQNALNAANEAKAVQDFHQKVLVYDNLPLQETHVNALYNLSKAAPEDFAVIENLFNASNTAMGAQFNQTGVDGDGTSAPTNAYEQIEKMVQDKRTVDPTMDYNTALNQVVTENPDLYNRYRDGE